MRVITHDQGRVVQVRDVESLVPKATTARESVGLMFEFLAGFRGWDKPVEELVKLVEEASDEALTEIRSEYDARVAERQAKLANWWGRAWVWVNPKALPSLPPMPTKAQIIGMYADKFERFLRWMDEKRVSSSFYHGSFGEEIPKCWALVEELRKKAAGQ